MAKQITVRGVSKQLSARLLKLSQGRAESLNTTVLGILEKAAGIDGRRERLARYATWSDDDLRDFEHALRAHRTIDAGLWK